MANPEHLELLRQGVDVWNEWRAKEPSIRPDLSEANLSRGEPPQGEPQRGGPHRGEPQRGEPLSGRTSTGRTSPGRTSSRRTSGNGGPQRGGPRRGETSQGEPHAGRTSAGEPQRGGPRRGEPHARRTSAGRTSAGRTSAGRPQGVGSHQSRRRDSHRLPHLRRIRMEREAQQRHETAETWSSLPRTSQRSQSMTLRSPSSSTSSSTTRRSASHRHGRQEGRAAARPLHRGQDCGPGTAARGTPQARLPADRLQLRQAGDEGLHGDRAAARWAVQVRHRRHHQPEVRAARTASDRVPRSWSRFSRSSRRTRHRSPCCRTCGSIIPTGSSEPIYYSSVDALIASLDEKIIRPAEARFVELVKRKAETMGGEHV